MIYTGEMKINPEVPKCYYRISVKAIITNAAGEMLMVRERGRDWDFPGGGLDWGEDTVPALHRELIEELGTDGEVDLANPGIVVWNNDVANVHLIWLLYKATVDPEKIQPTADVSESKFMSLNEFFRITDSQEQADWVCAGDFKQTLTALIER